ncbi:MAG: CDP-alcohol phosphatidyltransferase family protein [Gammaproteobacteria bacterium]|nr:CDP-alcohol phosphatidyltransferase family protein [Gammaproteobacteria bacterium]
MSFPVTRVDLIRRVPGLLTALRGILAPFVAILAIYAPRPEPFAVCLVAALVSDIFDGALARRLGVATPTLRRLDSAADTLFYVACLFAAWRLHPAAIAQRLVPLCILAGLEVFRYVFDFVKFRREASYHMWSAKFWGIALFVGFFSMLVFGSTGPTVSFAIYVGIVTDLEGVAISILLPRWQADMPSLVHALRARQNAGI